MGAKMQSRTIVAVNELAWHPTKRHFSTSVTRGSTSVHREQKVASFSASFDEHDLPGKTA